MDVRAGKGKGPSVNAEGKWAAEIARRVSTQKGYAGIYLSFIPDYPRNTDIRAIFHGVMFLRISGFFFVFLYFERLYIFQALNLEQTLPSIRKRDMPGAGIDPRTFRLRSQSTAIELPMLVMGRGVNLLTDDAITLLVSNYLI